MANNIPTAQTVKNETTNGANTANRVGGVLESLAKDTPKLADLSTLESFTDYEHKMIIKTEEYTSGTNVGACKYMWLDASEVPTLTKTAGGTSTGSGQFITVNTGHPYLYKDDLVRFASGGVAKMERDEAPTSGTLQVNVLIAGLPDTGTDYGYKITSFVSGEDANSGITASNIKAKGHIIECSGNSNYEGRWIAITENGFMNATQWGAVPNQALSSTSNECSATITEALRAYGRIFLPRTEAGSYYYITSPIDIDESDSVLESDLAELPIMRGTALEVNDDVDDGFARIRSRISLIYTDQNTTDMIRIGYRSGTTGATSDLKNIKLNVWLDTSQASGYSGSGVKYVPNASMNGHHINGVYYGNEDYVQDTAALGAGGEGCHIDPSAQTASTTGNVSSLRWNMAIYHADRGILIDSGGNYFNTDCEWECYMDNVHQAAQINAEGGTSKWRIIQQSRYNLDQQYGTALPMFEVTHTGNFGSDVDVRIWDMASGQGGNSRYKPTVAMGFSDTAAFAKARLYGESMHHAMRGEVLGLSFIDSISPIIEPDQFYIPARRKNLAKVLNISEIHNALYYTDQRTNGAFATNVKDGSAKDFDTELTESSGDPSAANVSTADMVNLCRPPGTYETGENFNTNVPTITYSSGAASTDFVEVVYDLDFPATVRTEGICIAFGSDSTSYPDRVQIITNSSGGSTNESVENWYPNDTGERLFITGSKDSAFDQLIVRFIGYDSLGDLEIDDISFRIQLPKPNSYPFPMRGSTGGQDIFSDYIWTQNGTGVVLTSPDGTNYRIEVDNAGSLSTTSI